MRTALAVCLSLWLAVSTCPGATVFVQVRDVTSNPVANRPVTLTLTRPTGASVQGPWVIAGDFVGLRTGSDGTAWFSNVLSLGEYRLDVAGNPSRSFPFSVSDTNGTFNVVQLLGTNLTAQTFYNSVQVDMLIGSGLGLKTTNNIVLTTNAAGIGVIGTTNVAVTNAAQTFYNTVTFNGGSAWGNNTADGAGFHGDPAQGSFAIANMFLADYFGRIYGGASVSGGSNGVAPSGIALNSEGAARVNGTLSVSNAASAGSFNTLGAMTAASVSASGNVVSAGQFVGNANQMTNGTQNRMNATNYHRYDAVVDFGAVNNGVSLYKVTNVTASTTLKAAGGIALVNGYYTNTTSPFASGDVGKVISIYKMGALTNNFTTTIATYVDPNTVTLTVAPSRGESNTFGVFGTDTTAQLQNALNVVSNWSAEIYFPDGIYVVNGAAGGANGAQLVVPPVNTGGLVDRVLRLKGNFTGFIKQAVQNSQPFMDMAGPTIWSTVTNLGSSGFGCVLDCQNHGAPVFTYSYSGDSGNRAVDFNQIRLENDGLNWRSCFVNNGITFGAHGAGSLYLANCRIDTGYLLYNVPFGTNAAGAATPFFATNTLGVATPPSTSAGQTKIDNVQIGGFYRAVTKGEHGYVTALQLESSVIGLDCNFYPSGSGHEGLWLVDFEACKTNIYARTISTAVDVVATTETPFSGDFSLPVCHIYDGLGSFRGRIAMCNTTDGSIVTDGSLPHAYKLTRLPAGSATYVTNDYEYDTLGHWDSGNVGTTALDQPLTLYSSGQSLTFGNTFANTMIFEADNLTKYWKVGVPGASFANGLQYDFLFGSFKDLITDGGKAALVIHYTDVIECRSNVVAGGSSGPGSGFIGDISLTTNNITSQSANYNVTANDSIVLLNGNLTATLPTAVGIPGKIYIILCKTSGTNAILSTSAQTFSGPLNVLGAAKWTNSAAGRSTTVVSDNANWWVLKTDN